MKTVSSFTRYFLVYTDSDTKYIKLTCIEPFTASEGVSQLKASFPKAKVTHIAKSKAEKFLHLF